MKTIRQAHDTATDNTARIALTIPVTEDVREACNNYAQVKAQRDALRAALRGMSQEITTYANDHAEISLKIWLNGMVKRYSAALAAIESEGQ